MVTVPAVVLLGFGAARLAPSGAENLWYAAIIKPAVTPPDWAFPVAWTGIYILLGLSLLIGLYPASLLAVIDPAASAVITLLGR